MKTEKSQAEYSEERFRLVVEAAPNAMIMVDREGKINLVNTQVERLFGYTREELLGQKIEKLVPERYRGKHPGHRDSFFQDPKARAMGVGRDLFGLKKDGTELPIEIGLNPPSKLRKGSLPWPPLLISPNANALKRLALN